MHDLIPVLAGDDSEESDDSFRAGFKVCVAVDHFSIFDGAKVENSEKSVAEEEQEHGEYDEEGFVHRNGDRHD